MQTLRFGLRLNKSRRAGRLKMKFTKEMKEKIDFFFDNITPLELYALSIKKYGFIENIDNQRFSALSKSLYNSFYWSVRIHALRQCALLFQLHK
ncbi:MAG: hypothetical protein EAZ15_01830 [Sphingobacteriales bacterium]|nr:MAG: hypothetical protein EAZ15_01830 [Sphingobacteriales bacterium]